MIRKSLFIIVLIALILSLIFAINLIFFRPFSIDHFYDKVFVKALLTEPEMLTYVGLPFISDYYNDQLGGASLQHRKDFIQQMADDLETLNAYSWENQSKEQQLSSRVLAVFLESQANARPFAHHEYAVNQLKGIHVDFPSLMLSAHQIEDEEDAQAYNKRLAYFPRKVEETLEVLAFQEKGQIVPPLWMVERIKGSIEEFRAHASKENPLYQDLKSKMIASDLWKNELAYDQAVLDETKHQIENSIYPAYDRLLQFFEGLSDIASTEDGAWKLPNGKQFYQHKIQENTTTNLTAEEVHQVGRKEVERLRQEIAVCLKEIDKTNSDLTLMEQIDFLRNDSTFLFRNSSEGRANCIQKYKDLIRGIEERMPEVFDLTPSKEVLVQAVPSFKEESSPGAYYEPAAMNGSRSASFYANLRDMNAIPTWSMPTLAYHEAIPGHHFQLGIQGELDHLPMFRRVLPFMAYAEGWALYAEQLAWEMGFYDEDPLGNLGRLQAEMFRAVRLVVDSGIHHYQWTRDEAIFYMRENTGMALGEVEAEVERYIAWPGQALAYKIGMLKILELRAKCKAQLQEEFDLKEFHRVILENGSVPLTVLEQLIEEYLEDKRVDKFLE